MEQTIPIKEIILVSYADEGPNWILEMWAELDVVQNIWISVDPYQRQCMKQSNVGLYLQNFQLKQVGLVMISISFLNLLLRSLYMLIIPKNKLCWFSYELYFISESAFTQCLYFNNS